ncbi:hypothetical protein PtB15_4B832 [Puccinia triticina]|nr:hypothetical protein PtB15_4B832 [Puccinia triticina]
MASTPETGSYSPTTSTTDSEPSSPPSQPPQLIIVNGKLIAPQSQQTHTPAHKEARQKRKYLCHWAGCQKSYTKPVRLEEHLRSHTNERPFSCPTCPAAYRRETHLTAHMRMHLPESSRPLLCGWQEGTIPSTSASAATQEGCPRRFWTQQQLKIHRENVHEGKKGQAKLQCDQCPKEFLKHNALRAHLVEAHCPPGTKSYMCPHPNCGFSFANPSRLRKHERTHDPFRYTCAHQDCLDNPRVSIQERSFSSWTDLQRHTRDCHPFKCTEPDCSRSKKPFKSLRSLKQHLLLCHPAPQQHQAGEPDGPIEPGVFATRNTGAFVCTQYPPCERAYKSARALQRHVNLIHLIDRHTSCPVADCSFSSAFPSGLAKHIKSKHPPDDQPAAPPPKKRTKPTRVQKLSQIDVQPAFRKFACPFFTLSLAQPDPRFHAAEHNGSAAGPEEGQEEQPGSAPQASTSPTDKRAHLSTDPEMGREEDTEKCLFRFNRLYDIQRHLKSHHSMPVDRETLKDFYGVA